MPELLRRRKISPQLDGPTRSLPGWIVPLGWSIAGAVVGGLLAWVLWGRVLNHWNSPWRMAVGYAPLVIVEDMQTGDHAIGYLAVMGTISEQIEAGRRWFIVLSILGAAGGFVGHRFVRRRRSTAAPSPMAAEQMRKIVWIAAVIGAVGVIGGGAAAIFNRAAPEPRLDATSDESWAASCEKVRERLPVDERARFDAALQWLSLQGENAQGLLFNPNGLDAAMRRHRERAHGLTATEVIAKALEGSPRHGEPLDPPEPPKTWADARTQTIGLRSVTIDKISRGPLPLQDTWGGGVRQTDEEFTVFAVTIRNLSNTQKISYTSWAYDDTGAGRTPTLTDDLGNTYRRRYAGSFSDRVVGAVGIMSEMYPSTDVRDIIAFERPVDAATTLFLELPARNVGEEGAFRFRIPVTTIVSR